MATEHVALLAVLLFLMGGAFGALTMVIFWGYIIPNIRLMQVVKYGESHFVVVGYQPNRTFDHATVELVRKDVYERAVREDHR